jgi:hypothetical protein
MSTIVIKYDGTDITDDIVFSETRFTSVADGQAGTATIVIDDEHQDYDASSFITGKTLELYVDGTREWDGWVFKVTRGWPFIASDTTIPTSVPRKWTIEGFDRNLLFTKRVLHNVSDPDNTAGFKVWPEDTMDRTAIIHSLDNYVDLTGDGLDISTGIKPVASPGPYEEFQLGANAMPWSTMFEEAAQITGAVYYIDPDRVVRYNDDLTVTAPFTISDTPTAGQVGYREFDAILDFTEAANQAIVLGAGLGRANIIGVKYTNSSSVGSHGLWQWGDVFHGAYKLGTVTKRARTYVEGSPSHQRGHDEPVPTVRCTLFTPGIRAGMVVLIVSSVYGYSEALPVRNIMMTFPTPTSVRYDLEASLKIDMPYGAPDRLPPLRFPPGDDPPPLGGIDPPPPLPPLPELPVVGTLIDHFDEVQDVLQVVEGTLAAASTQNIPLPEGPKSEGDLLVVFGIMDSDPELGTYLVHPDLYIDGFSSDWSNWWNGPDERSNAFGLTSFVPAGHSYTGSGDTMSIDIKISLPAGQAGDPYAAVVHYVACLIPVEHHDHTNDHASPSLQNTAYAAGPTISGESWFGGDLFTSRSADEQANLHLIFGARGGLGTTMTGVVKEWVNSYPTDNSVEPGWDVAALQTARSGDVPAYALNWKVRTGVDSEDASDVDILMDSAFTDIYSAAGRVFYLGVSITSDAADALTTLVTPGPEVTEATWPGGNPYGWGTDDILVEDSRVYFIDPGAYLDIYSPYYKGVNPDQGSWFDEGDTHPRPIPWGKTPSDLLFKFRREAGSVGSDHGQFFIHHQMVDQDADFGAAWAAEVQVQVEWAADGESQVEAWIAPADGTGIAESAYPDGLGHGTPPVGDYLYYYGDVDGDFIRRIYYDDSWTHHAWFSVDDIEADTDYYLRIEYGAEVTDEDSNLKTFRVKLWKTSVSEPGWLIDHHMPMYRVGSSMTTYLGHPNEQGANDNDLVVDAIDFVTKLGANDERIGFDGWWEYATGVGVEPVQYTGGTAIDYAVMLDTNGVTATMVTSAPYAPGSLEVIHNGITLRPGIDFIELDPEAGTFIINVSPATGFGVSQGIVVKYEPAGEFGTTASASITYRPDIVLLHGWGSINDPYNAAMACSAMALDRHTSGTYSKFTGSPRSNPLTHRTYSGLADETVSSVSDAANAWSAGWSQTLVTGTYTWSEFDAMLAEGRGAILAGDVDELEDWGAVSGHCLYINDMPEDGFYFGYDPRHGYPLLYTQSELQAYAVGHTVAGKVVAGFTAVT